MFAEGTDVPVERSRAEIEKTLTRYGATRFGSMWDQESASIAFEAHGRRVRFEMAIPTLEAVKKTPAGRTRNARDQQAARAAEERRRWRALNLVIKAKLEAVASGVASFESEFLAHIVLPSGATVEDWLTPQLAVAFSTGRMPPLLPK